MAINTSWSGQRHAFPPAMRTHILRRDPECQCTGCSACSPAGCMRPSTIADHKLCHAECLRQGINPDTINNGQGMCEPCHNIKTKAESIAGHARLRPRRIPTHPASLL